jgi:Peptidase propeptide and YPEB domain
MMRTLLASAALLAVAAFPAKADRPVTEAQRAKLEQAVAAQGCTGGKMEWDEDDREFEVEDARCSDGHKYDLKFHADYTLKRKKMDD